MRIHLPLIGASGLSVFRPLLTITLVLCDCLSVGSEGGSSSVGILIPVLRFFQIGFLSS